MTPEQPSSLARPVEHERLEELARLLEPAVEVIAELQPTEGTASRGVCGAREILDLLERRPCTANGVASGLGLHLNEALMLSGDVVVVTGDGQPFYAARRPAS